MIKIPSDTKIGDTILIDNIDFVLINKSRLESCDYRRVSLDYLTSKIISGPIKIYHEYKLVSKDGPTRIELTTNDKNETVSYYYLNDY